MGRACSTYKKYDKYVEGEVSLVAVRSKLGITLK
jgi:hypothetical protein